MTHARIQIIPSGAGEGVPEVVNAFKSSALFHRGPYRTTQEAIGPEVSNCFLRGSVPIFLSKHKANYDFLGKGTPILPPLDWLM